MTEVARAQCVRVPVTRGDGGAWERSMVDFCSIFRRLHRSFKVNIGLDEASCPEVGGSRPRYTSALSAQRGSNPGNKIAAQKLLST